MHFENYFPTEFYDEVILLKKNRRRMLSEDYRTRIFIYCIIESGSYSTMDYAFQTYNEFFTQPIIRKGPISGFGSLHLACLQNRIHVATKIVEEYHMDVNVAAKDGIQPIQLACLFGRAEIVKILGQAGANINAEISRKLFSKYRKDKEWCSDFRTKMTLITYAITVLHENVDLIRVLINLKSNLKIKSSRNKTLLMYLLQHGQFILAGELLMNEEYKKFINIRDNDGLHFIHYILHPEKYGDYRSVGSAIDERWDNDAGYFASKLYYANIDIYKTINNDPDTLLFNIAAYRNSPAVLKALLPYYTSIKKSKALYYSLLPPGGPEKYVLPTLPYRDRELRTLQNQRKRSKNLILLDLINRLTFGLPVPEEEKTLMDQSIFTDKKTEEFVENYKINFIQGVLKKNMIQYGNQTISHYDFILISADQVKLRMLIRNTTFFGAVMDFIKNVSLEYDDNYYYFQCLLRKRINKACQRIQLLNELKNIPNLRTFIPVPYEWILDIVDNLSNQDLETFISAFYLKFSIKYDKYL